MVDIYTPSKPHNPLHTSETIIALSRIRAIATAAIGSNNPNDQKFQQVLRTIKNIAETSLYDGSIINDDDHHYR
jgi:hypothetical protein